MLIKRKNRVAARESLAVLATLCCCISTMNPSASAQECRESTSQEKQVIEKLIHALQDNLEPALLGHGWIANGGSSALPDPQIAKHPAPLRPLMVCMAPYTGKFALDPHSERGQKMADSSNYYLSQNTPEGIRNMTRVAAGSEIDIRMAENLPYLNISVRPGTKPKRLDLPGVALAIQMPAQGSQVETQLYFGNWDHAKLVSGNEAYTVPYPFGHKMGDPYIVNMVVHITATPEVTAELLKMVDWRRVGAGLTP